VAGARAPFSSSPACSITRGHHTCLWIYPWVMDTGLFFYPVQNLL
jgi:hypothetical protein